METATGKQTVRYPPRYGHAGDLSGLAAFGKSSKPFEWSEWGAMLARRNLRGLSYQRGERRRHRPSGLLLLLRLSTARKSLKHPVRHGDLPCSVKRKQRGEASPGLLFVAHRLRLLKLLGVQPYRPAQIGNGGAAAGMGVRLLCRSGRAGTGRLLLRLSATASCVWCASWFASAFPSPPPKAARPHPIPNQPSAPVFLRDLLSSSALF